MTSQIPNYPLTPEALARLTPDEQRVFSKAAKDVAEGWAAGNATVAGLVLMVQRLIAEPVAANEPPLEVRPGGAVVLRPDGGEVLVVAFAPDVPPERAAEVSHNLHHASGLKVVAVADVAAVKGWQPDEEDDETPGYWQVRAALTGALSALALVAISPRDDHDEVVAMARETLTETDAVLAKEPRPEPGEAEVLREQLAVVKERLETTAMGMEMSASTTAPSKKSEIEQGCARAIRGIAGQITVESARG